MTRLPGPIPRSGALALALAAGVLVCGALPAATTVASPSSVARILQAFSANQQALLGYRWKTRTKIQLGDAVEQVALFSVQPGTAGRLERVRIVEPEEPGIDGQPSTTPQAPDVELPHVERPEFEVPDEVCAELEQLVRSYQNLDPTALARVEALAPLWAGPVILPGWTSVAATDVIHEGDSYALWVDTATLRPRRLEITLPADETGSEVQATVEYSDLIVGATYPARTTIATELDGRPLLLTLADFDFRRRRR